MVVNTSTIIEVLGEQVRLERVSGHLLMGTLVEQPWVWEVGKTEKEVCKKLAACIAGTVPGSGYAPRSWED